MTSASNARIEYLQGRAVAAVQRLTGLNVLDAQVVVRHGRFDLYDSAQPSGVNKDNTLGDDVQRVVADVLDGNTTTTAFAAAALLGAVDLPQASAHGETLELRLSDERLGVAGAGSWSYLEVPADDGGVEFWWTGLADTCPDALLVADALKRVFEDGDALAGRRVRDLAHLIPRCQACGGGVVPVVHGMPDEELVAAAALGQVRLAGCLVPGDGAGTGPIGECVDCGQQRGIAMEEDCT